MEAATLLRRARTGSHLTLRELASLAGTSHSTLSAYETGRKVPTVDTLDRIVRAAGLELVGELAPSVGGVDRRPAAVSSSRCSSSPPCSPPATSPS